MTARALTFLGLALLATSTACSSSKNADAELPDDPDVLLDPPESGIQLRMVTSVESGAEVEKCQFVKLGPEDLLVNHDEIRFSEGSHHVLLFQTDFTELPTETGDGRAIDPGEIFDCSDGPQSGLGGFASFLAGSQNSRGDAMLSYPADTAIRVPGDTVVMINAHYINTTPDVLYPEVLINLHTIAEDEMQVEGGIYFWYDPFIRVPARSTASANMACDVGADVHFTSLQSHMHARGDHFEAVLTAPDGTDTVIYESGDWEDVEAVHLDPGLVVEAGSRIRFDCFYDNKEERDVFQGFKTTDEMCVFAGSYWPKSEDVGLCFTDATWEGQGTAGCADTLACLQGVQQGSDGMFATLSTCMMDASPEVAEPLSAAMGCLSRSFVGGSENAPDCTAALEACNAL